jgi:hypothetical protein
LLRLIRVFRCHDSDSLCALASLFVLHFHVYLHPLLGVRYYKKNIKLYKLYNCFIM